MRFQRFILLHRELKHKVFRKSFAIPFHRFVEPERGHLIKLSQVGIKHDLVAANDVNAAFNQLDGYRELLLAHFAVQLRLGYSGFAAVAKQKTPGGTALGPEPVPNAVEGAVRKESLSAAIYPGLTRFDPAHASTLLSALSDGRMGRPEPVEGP